MNDEERVELVQKLQKDVEDFVSGLKPKKYEDGWPEDRWEEEMEKHPIFMSKPVEEGQEMPPLVEAMQQLKYDPEFNSSIELAMSYKEDGNQNFKRKKYRWAVDSYTKGLDAKCENRELNAVLYNNRAAAHYHIGNYRKALNDATQAKLLNPSHVKAIHRGALCCLELKLYEDCILWCEEGLKMNASDDFLKDLKSKAQNLKNKTELLEKEAAEQELKERLELQSLNKAIQERGIKFEGKGLTAKCVEPVYPEACSAKVHLTPEGALVWPVILLYPEYGTSDFIQGFDENTCFYDHLEVMFEECPSWDIKKEYVAKSLQVYFSDSKELLVPVDKMQSLKSVMCDERFRLKSGTLTFLVTVKDSEFDKYYRKQHS